MAIFFLRHGEADWPDWDKPDDERPLTPEGRKEMRKVARFLKALRPLPTLIVTSPLIRASQTAEIVAKELKVPLVIERALSPGFNAVRLERIQRDHLDEILMLVGHEPDFSDIIARLTGGRVKMAKAGVALVEDKGTDTGELVWLFPPRIAKASTRK